MRPGIGTVVASAPRTLAEMQRQLMEHEVATLIAEARRIGLSADELKRAIDACWEKTAAAVEVGR
jgi:DNA-binding transcriptional regulator YhcF (GntR family)